MEIKGPTLSMELCSGESITRVQKVTNPPSGSVMSIHELTMLDDVEFQLHYNDDSPGVCLKKQGIVSWTPPIATSTSSTVLCKENKQSCRCVLYNNNKIWRYNLATAASFSYVTVY